MKYNEFGEELPDDTPVEVPLRLRSRRPPTIQEMIAMYVRQERALDRQMGGRSEADEEEDFDVDEDGEDEILTPYELHALAAETEMAENQRSRELSRYKGIKYGRESAKDSPGVGSDREGAGKSAGAEAGLSDTKDAAGARAPEGGAADKR